MISRYMIKILSFDINNHISQMISTNPRLFKSLNSIKTRHITLRLIIFQICAFSVFNSFVGKVVVKLEESASIIVVEQIQKSFSTGRD